jgi:hypothetical protein
VTRHRPTCAARYFRRFEDKGERIAESNPPAAARIVLRIRVTVERFAAIQRGKRWVWRFLAIAAWGRRNGTKSLMA